MTPLARKIVWELTLPVKRRTLQDQGDPKPNAKERRPMSDLFRDLTPDEKALKVMTGLLVAECGGPKLAAEIIGGGIKGPYVSAYSSHTEANRWLPVRSLMLLEDACHQPVLTRWLADRQGMHLIPVASQDGDGATPLSVDDIVTFAGASATFKLKLAGAVADGKIDAAERADLRRALLDILNFATDALRAVEKP